ncbi:putative sporulation protein YtxC [Paenibacillus sp. N1-5-1-14]|uniref:putative sporulation protein YtxC n=1 Tax=Paenibacillus radicibacter TaxID=2972488 RepID=UPI002158DD75|nr:putative sporulation protein YtxC [Paenibacillus radicibacter]MCR8644851.1 putative sporulation protein YtxC [Paenibacillus radicibacter]
MELLSLYIKSRSETDVRDLCGRIETELRDLHNENNGVQLQISGQDQSSKSYVKIAIQAILPGFQLLQMSPLVYQAVSSVLAEHLLIEEEPRLLKDMIHKEFHYQEMKDIDAIEKYCEQFLNGEHTDTTAVSTEARNRRKSKISKSLYEYMEQHVSLNLDGYMRFRLGEYMEELREIVEYAIDEYTMEQQYQEFISLLKYFVYIQEAKVPIAHLIHKGGHEFEILNELMQPINPADFESTLTMEHLEKDMNFEDMIVSTLITVSPASIFIHTREPDLSIIKTIRQIFEDRTEVCPSCRICHHYLGERIKQDGL